MVGGQWSKRERSKMRFPLWRRRRDEELQEEVDSHLQMATRERLDRGEPLSQAEISARRELGNLGLVKEVTRNMWGLLWLERLIQDIRYGLRVLRKTPVFTAVAI